MGRIFEVRKATMFARWDRMAKQFTRIGKEIVIAVKQGGPNPDHNPALRRCIQNAKGVNMPKDRVEAAIKRASEKQATGFETCLYEGYAPHGVAVLVETATDNPVRTVANIRMHFNRGGGSLSTAGSVAFLFKRLGQFKFPPHTSVDLDTLELDLIDVGLEELGTDATDQVIVRCAFSAFGDMQKALEDRSITIVESELTYIPTTLVSLEEGDAQAVLEVIDKLEQDEDVQKVYHNLA